MKRTGVNTEVYLADPESGKRHRACPTGRRSPGGRVGGMEALGSEAAGLLRARETGGTRMVCVMCSKFLKVKTA